jgi:hypothetical protein
MLQIEISCSEWGGRTIIGGIQIRWDDELQNTLGTVVNPVILEVTETEHTAVLPTGRNLFGRKAQKWPNINLSGRKNLWANFL